MKRFVNKSNSTFLTAIKFTSIKRICCVLATVLALTPMANSVFAQGSFFDDAFTSPRSTRVRCHSVANRFERCPTPFAVSAVTLADFGPNEKCELGRSWGYDSQSVWVSKGCRGYFDVIEGSTMYETIPPPPDAFTQVCRSQEEELRIPGRQTRWARLHCIGPCNVVSYAATPTGALCSWRVDAREATLTCFNSGREVERTKATVFCAR